MKRILQSISFIIFILFIPFSHYMADFLTQSILQGAPKVKKAIILHLTPMEGNFLSSKNIVNTTKIMHAGKKVSDVSSVNATAKADSLKEWSEGTDEPLAGTIGYEVSFSKVLSPSGEEIYTSPLGWAFIPAEALVPSDSPLLSDRSLSSRGGETDLNKQANINPVSPKATKRTTPKPTPKPTPKTTAPPKTYYPKPSSQSSAPSPVKTQLPEPPKTNPPTSDDNQNIYKVPSTYSLSQYEKNVVELVNAERKNAGCNALNTNIKLSYVACLKSKDFYNKNYFSHTSPTYGTLTDVARSFSIPYSMLGENIAMGQTSPASVMDGWMNSSGHRQNILNPGYNQLGVGHYQGANGGKLLDPDVF